MSALEDLFGQPDPVRERLLGIAACGACDEAGWVLGTDGVPADPARKCDHADRVEDWRDR